MVAGRLARGCRESPRCASLIPRPVPFVEYGSLRSAPAASQAPGSEAGASCAASVELACGGHAPTATPMSHFPRWIDEHGMDSPAMLSAFLDWVHNAPTACQADVRGLYIIGHNMKTFGAPNIPVRLPDGVPMVERACKDAECARCLGMRGGYQFRWYDPRWAARYNKIRRMGSTAVHACGALPRGYYGVPAIPRFLRCTAIEGRKVPRAADWHPC